MQEIKMLEFKELEILYIRLILKIMSVFFIAQFLLIYFDYNGYIGLLFCPLIYLFTKKQQAFFGKGCDTMEIFIHIVGYLLIVVVSSIIAGGLSLWMVLLYFTTYGILMNLQLQKQGVILVSTMSKYLLRLFWQFVFLAIFSTLLHLWEYYCGNLGDLSASLIWKEILILNLLFSLFLLIYLKRVTKQLKLQRDKNSLTSDLAEQIIFFFESSEEFLNPKFDMSCLARSLGVQKVLVSQAINRELHVSFYLLVAKYRINYAKCMLMSKEVFSINAIMQQCGFHSRSTFYKYFKMYVGLKPDQYRSKQLGSNRN